MSGGFNFSYSTSESGYNFVPSTRNATPIELSTGNFVGNIAAEDFKKYTLNTKSFIVSRFSGEKSLASADGLWIKNGLFGKEEYEQNFTFTGEELEQIVEPKIYIDLEDTNLYGKLIIGLNDKKIFSGFIEGKKEIPVNKSLFNENNKLVITAESSSWRLWAPTVYIIDFDLRTRFFGESSQAFDFNVPKENTPVKYSRLILNIPEKKGSGNLIVKMNNQIVFNSTPTSIQWIEFDDIVKEGNNTISMVSGGNAEFKIKEAQMIIFFDKEASETLEYKLHITNSNYNELPGNIRFKIDRVFGNPTSLVAKIIDPDGRSHSLVVQGILEEGKYITINLPKSYVKPGDNKIIFSVTGDGGYSIKDLTVDY